MSVYVKPEVEQVSEMLSMFITGGVEVEAADGAPGNLSHAAIYRDPEGAIVATCACDIKMAAGLGASLSMVPPSAVEDMLASGSLTDIVNANLYEVMNMLSSLLMNDNSAHLKLTEVLPVAELPADASNEGFQSQCFALTAGNYGSGHLVINSL